MSEKAQKNDDNKPRLELIPPSYWKSLYGVTGNGDVTLHLCSASSWFVHGKGSWLSRNTGSNIVGDPVPAFEFGARKYAAFNYLRGIEYSRLVGAFMRHCAVLDGERGWFPRKDLREPDEESGLPHSSHAEACRLMLMELVDLGRGINDCPWNVKK